LICVNPIGDALSAHTSRLLWTSNRAGRRSSSRTALELGRQPDVPLPTTAMTNEMLTTARGMVVPRAFIHAVF
jgi:hypothetical protein